MNTRDATVRWRVVVYGDWSTVIGVREYREQLIDQKPHVDSHDDPELEYRAYYVDCVSAKEMVAAFSAFGSHRLRCEFQSLVNTANEKTERLVTCFANTGGWDSHGEPYADISINETAIVDKVRDSVERAIKILGEVIA